MILYRCFAWNERAAAAEQDGPLWFARVFQGEGRHDKTQSRLLPTRPRESAK